MPETEPPKKQAEKIETPHDKPQERTAIEELAKRAQQSTRYERLNKKDQQKKAEEMFEKLKKGEVPKLDLKAMSAADLKAAKEIIADIEQSQRLAWLSEGGIPDNPIVLDVIARIASAPKELQGDPKWLIAQGLELQDAQKGGMPNDVKFAIQKVSNRIRERVVELTGISDNERGLIHSSAYETEKLTSVSEEQAEIVDVADYYLSEAGRAMRFRRRPPGGPPAGPPRIIVPSEWLYDPAHAPANPAVRTAVETINNTYANNPRADYLNQAYEQLENMASADPTLRAEIDPYVLKIKETFRVLIGERYILTPAEIHKLRTDSTYRDNAFYDRIRTVLFDPNKQSRELMNLYKEAELEAFIYAISTLPQGDRLVKHYNNLKEAIFSFHDLDFYARSAAGDIKAFQQAATYFQNAYTVEAISDPLVEAMMQSYEQALKMIRDNNDNYIPPSLVSYDPGHTENYWDELAKTIFRKKVEAGLIHDYDRDPNGLPITETNGRTLRQGGVFNIRNWDDPEQQLRITATMRMAKGLGILNMRLLEIFAFSKTPGYMNASYGTESLVFSSKAYEGIARWLNPMADWFGKFKMGDSMFYPFFSTLVGLDEPAIKEFFTWNQNQWATVVDKAANGELHEWYRNKFPDKAEKVSQLLDLVSEFAFTGRFGPESGWGETDATIGFTDFDREREGGSLRLFKAQVWGERQAKEEYFLAQHWPIDARSKAHESDWTKIKHTKEWKDKIGEYSDKYKTLIWVQLTKRSPTIVAGSVRMAGSAPGETYTYMGEQRPRLLRSVVIRDILGPDYDIEEQVKSEPTPTDRERRLMRRIELLESDVMLVQQAALYGGPDNRPRDIEIGDLDRIVDTNQVAQQERRDQAWQYIQEVKRRMLGTFDEHNLNFDYNDVYTAADGSEHRNNVGHDGKLRIRNVHKIEDIIRPPAGETRLLDTKLLKRKTPQHMGLEDVQWRYLDMQALGERHWARRANDLQNRSDAILALNKSLDTLRPNPDLKEIGKALEDIYNAEKNHFPQEAHRFIYLWSRGIGEMYRQRIWAKVPFLGRLVSKLRPSSIAAQIYGPEHGASWSANNEREYIDTVQQTTKLPYREVDRSGVTHDYNIHKLENELGATRLVAIAEMIGLGVAIAIAATALTALTKSLEEDK